MARRVAGRRHRVLALAGAVAALLAQTQGVAAAESWTVTASPQTIVAGSSDSVRLTIQNTSSPGGGNNGIGCVRVTIPATFTVGTPAVVSVSNGRDWSASRSGHTVTAKGDSNGDRLREDPTNDTLVLDVPASASLVAPGPWTVRAYEKDDCTKGSFQPKSILITVIVSPTPKPTPKPSPKPSATPAPTPKSTGAPTAAPTRSPGPTSREPSSSASPVATPVPTAAPGIGLGGPPPPADPPPDGGQFESAISIPVDEADPSFSGLSMELLASLGVFAWAVPGALLAAPGLLLIVVILAQSMGALAWLPIVRRQIGDFGLAHRLTSPRRPA